MIILIDTRENKPLKFKKDYYVEGTKKLKLDVGDYGAVFKDGYQVPIVFERKSIGDLYGTLSKGYKRFKREIKRSAEADVSLIIIIEGTLTEVFKGYPHSGRSPQSVVKQIFTLKVRYGVNTVFCSSRKEMSRYIVNLFIACGKEHVRSKKSK